MRNASAVAQALQLVGLTADAQKYPRALSGGMQQRVAVARGIVLKPAVLLMDEPFSALDELRRDELAQEFLMLQQVLHQTVIFVTHSIYEAAYLADRVLVLSERPGKVRFFEDMRTGSRLDSGYRQTDEFFKRVVHLRSLLKDAGAVV